MITRRSALRFIILLGITMSISVLPGCGGGSSGNSSATLTSIQITPANPSIAKETKVLLTATGAYSDHTTRDLTSQVTWSSSSLTVASVDSGGMVTGNAQGTATITASKAGISGTVSLTVTTAALIADPPADDSSYFQIMLDNRISSGQTVHLTATANQMQLNSTFIEKITWLTGGGASFDDWTRPVFQVVDSTSGSNATGANFNSTYDVTLDKLPLDPTGQYRILKIPFLMPGDSTRSLAGSGHLTITLGTPAVMQINTGGPDAAGFSFALPSPDRAGAGGMNRWDFLEFNCATPASSGKPVCFVNTTNVDFFSLGVTIKGRKADGSMATFGLDLDRARPVTSTLAALKGLTGDYAAGLVTSSSGAFLRFLAPGHSFGTSATALDTAITNGYNYYKTTPLKFNVGAVSYEATTVGNSLAFTAPLAFTVDKPKSWEVAAAKGPLDVAGKAVAIQNGLKYLAAYLNRGVFENTALWNSPTQWYPTGSIHNEYSHILHLRFINGATYGFSFDDVPGGGVTSDPSIPTCTSMSLVLTDD